MCSADAFGKVAAHKKQALLQNSSRASAVHATSQPVMAIMAPLQSPMLSGFCMHPAVLDATLHLSAAALPTNSTKRSVTRVPAGISSLAISNLKHGDIPVPLAQPSKPQQDGAVLCQYKLLAGSGCSVQLSDLLAKEARPMPSAQSSTSAASAEVATSELLYETQWQVASAAGSARSGNVLQQPCFALNKPTGAIVGQHVIAAFGKVASSEVPLSQAGQVQHGLRVLLDHGPQTTGSSVRSVNAMLELWQSMAAQCQGTSVSLLSKAYLGSDLAGISQAGTTSTAAVSALMRVAAAENPGVSFAGLTSDPMISAHHEVDAYLSLLSCTLRHCQFISLLL